MYRSRARAAPLLSRVFAQYGIPLHDRLRAAAGPHRRWAAGCSARARCALLGARGATPRTCSPTCERPGAARDAARSPTGWRPRSAAARCAPPRRRASSSAGSSTSSTRWPRAPRSRPGSCAGWRGGCSPPRTAATAPRADRRQELDARALRGAGRAPSTSSPSWGCIRPRRGADRAAGGHRRWRRTAPGRASDAVLLAEPLEMRARRFRAVFVCGLQEGEFPRPGAPGAVPVRRAPPGAGRRVRAAAAPARGLAGRRALPVLRGAVARHRARRSRLPQLRRGGQPRAAVAVHRRRGRAARRRLARPAATAAARRRRLGPAAGADGARAGALARPPARGAVAGEEPDRRRALGAGRRWPRCATARSCRRARSRPTRDCPVRWLIERELAARRRSTPEPEPITRGNLMHERARAAAAGAGRPGDAGLAADRAVDPGSAAGRAGAADRAARAGGGQPGRRARRGAARRSRPTCAATWSTRRARTAAGGRSGLELRFGFDGEEGVAAGAGARRRHGAGRWCAG